MKPTAKTYEGNRPCLPLHVYGRLGYRIAARDEARRNKQPYTPSPGFVVAVLTIIPVVVTFLFR